MISHFFSSKSGDFEPCFPKKCFVEVLLAFLLSPLSPQKKMLLARGIGFCDSGLSFKVIELPWTSEKINQVLEHMMLEQGALMELPTAFLNTNVTWVQPWWTKKVFQALELMIQIWFMLMHIPHIALLEKQGHGKGKGPLGLDNMNPDTSLELPSSPLPQGEGLQLQGAWSSVLALELIMQSTVTVHLPTQWHRGITSRLKMTGAQALQCMILSEVLEVSKNPWDHFPFLLPPVLNRACLHYGSWTNFYILSDCQVY